jgi:hypothetical protein
VTAPSEEEEIGELLGARMRGRGVVRTRGLSRVRLHADLTMIARLGRSSVEREPFRSLRSAVRGVGELERHLPPGLVSCPQNASEEPKMGVWDKLRDIGNYVRRRWPSADPDSYYQYKAARERERKQTERTREQAERVDQQGRVSAERGRENEERYTAERVAEEPRENGS